MSENSDSQRFGIFSVSENQKPRNNSDILKYRLSDMPSILSFPNLLLCNFPSRAILHAINLNE